MHHYCEAKTVYESIAVLSHGAADIDFNLPDREENIECMFNN